MAGVQEVLAERYELLEVLGRGGMGVVYRARDRVLDRVVAVKVLPLDRARDPTSVARFEREALAAAGLSTRNIVAVFDFGTDRETRFIVMEYLAGQSLAERVQQRPLGVGEAVDVATQIAAALAVAHEAGIVHRDIKPANVMVDGQGHVKVLDFGIARLTAGSSLTQTATVLGSAPYLAPELCRGAAADARSDIYALGCVLYELLSGRPPFTGELPAAIVHRQLSATPRSLAGLNKAIPPALAALIMAMLAKDPARRPQSAGAVLTALSALATVPAESAATAPLTARPPRREAATRVMPSRPVATLMDSRAPIPRRALAVAALLVVLGAVLVLLETTGGPRPAPAAHHEARTHHRARKSTTSTTLTTGTTSTTAAKHSATPPTVATAVATLGALTARDVQAGTIGPPAANAIVGDAQAILAAAGNAQSGPAIAGLVKLGSDIRANAQHGQISVSAIPALNAAAANLSGALQRALASASTTQTSSNSGPPPPGGTPHGQGHAPGQLKQPQGQGDQGGGD